MRPRLYIAGPMSGIEAFNYPAFAAAESLLRQAGYDAASPHHHGEGDTSKPWEWYMRRALAELITCDAVALLPGWEQSRGACIEHQVARALGMATRPLPQWVGFALAGQDAERAA
jgi:hypothetical protein